MENKFNITEGKNIVVKQVKSASGQYEKQVKTLAGLGLGKIGDEAKVTATKSVIGMLNKVKHLVEVI